MINNPTPSQLDQLRQLWKLAFGDEDSFIDKFFENGYAPQRCRCITREETVVAALYWFDVQIEDQKAAYVYGVATHPDFRGQGLCRRLMADTHAHLAALGYASVLLVPQKEELRQMYLGLGYRNCTKISEFFCSDDPYPAPMHAIDREDYTRLRRQQMPSGTVIQEGENLDFLGSYAKFYKGMDFLMAAVIEGDHLFAPEFLGNRGSAAGVLCSLGCCQGTFRTPGDKMDFAMIHPLAENAIAPAHFAFAFD